MNYRLFLSIFLAISRFSLIFNSYNSLAGFDKRIRIRLNCLMKLSWKYIYSGGVLPVSAVLADDEVHKSKFKKKKKTRKKYKFQPLNDQIKWIYNFFLTNIFTRISKTFSNLLFHVIMTIYMNMDKLPIEANLLRNNWNRRHTN